MIDYKDTLAMGFSESHRGTKMLRYAANYAAEQQNKYGWEMRVTKNIYPEVAFAFRTKASRVERNIRHAIQAAGYDLNNSEMIARMAAMSREKGAKRDENGISP